MRTSLHQQAVKARVNPSNLHQAPKQSKWRASVTFYVRTYLHMYHHHHSEWRGSVILHVRAYIPPQPTTTVSGGVLSPSTYTYVPPQPTTTVSGGFCHPPRTYLHTTTTDHHSEWRVLSSSTYVLTYHHNWPPQWVEGSVTLHIRTYVCATTTTTTVTVSGVEGFSHQHVCTYIPPPPQ